MAGKVPQLNTDQHWGVNGGWGGSSSQLPKERETPTFEYSPFPLLEASATGYKGKPTFAVFHISEETPAILRQVRIKE